MRRRVRRHELRRGTDADLVVDLLLGVQWYRLLAGHLPTRLRDARARVDAAQAAYRT